MDDIAATLLSRVRTVSACLYRRRWLALVVGVLFATGSAVVVWKFPNRYEATARVFVDTETVLKPLMSGITFQPDIDLQVRMLARTLISRPNVERLLKTPDLGLDETDAASHEKAVASLMERIKVVPDGAGTGNLYQISYRGTSRRQAERVVESTVDLFVHSGTGARRRDSRDAGRFIEEQIKAYEGKLVEAENRLKDFKLRNFGVSGVSDQDHFARLSALSDEVNKLRLSLSAAEQSRDAYRRELSGEAPQLPVLGPRTMSPELADVEGRLESQRKQLDDLLRRFTDEHPDVISARRIITQLESQAQRLRADASRKADSDKPALAATSPIYQKIRVSLAEAEAQVASVRAQLAVQERRLEQARTVAGRFPQVEAELAQLNRDYEIIRKQYDLMVSRRESASIGMKLDESSQLADFRLVEPPQVSQKPVFPSKLHLALLASLGAVVAGVLAPLAFEFFRPTFADMKSLEAFSGKPVLGSISALVLPETHHAERNGAMRFAVVVAALLVLQGAWVAWVASSPLAR